MGRNRKWVLEDSLQEAVWRTIIRGPRPPSARWPQKAKRSPSTATPSLAYSPPSSHPTKAAPKSKVSSIQATISALGADPDLAHVQAEPGKSPDARVAEAQARVSRYQAWLDEKGAERAVAKRNSQFMEDIVGDSRSSRMASSIDAADAKRPCLEPVP